MNHYTKSLLALLCSFSAAAFAVDATPLAPDTAQVGSPAKSKKCPCPPLSDATLRERLSKAGIDLDSPQGEVILQFSKKAINDPKLRDRLFASMGSELPLWGAKLSQKERLRSLQLMKTMVTATPKDCKIFRGLQQGDFFRYLPQMSPVAVQSMFEVAEIAAMHQASDDETDTSSTIAERLEAEKFVKSAFEPGTTSEPCEQIRLVVDRVSSAAEPLQGRASLALLRWMEHQPSAADSVRSNPETYLDEAFDERALPEWVRNSLPPDGSRPLPFKRAVFDMEWINETTPTSSQRIIGTLFNRRNNGVVASILVPARPPKDADWAQFSLVYGTATLRSHLVDATLSEHQANLQDATALTAARQPLKEGATLRIPLPQPNARGETERVCTVGGERPASTVFEKLTGSATDLYCKQTSAEGVVTELHDVWLADYQADMTLSATNQYGKNELVVHGVTFE